ncbi:hypothetical protein Tco_0578617 [Tanacetum coccineum]
MYKGYLSDPWEHEFESRSMMVEEDNGKDSGRIRRLYHHLGSHPNIVNFIDTKESILLRALHIYNKEHIHGKLEPFNVGCNSYGIVKLFGVMGYQWTPQNEPQELLDLGSLLSKRICKNRPDMSAYEKENPVACDVSTNCMTLLRLMRHNYMWDSEATMKFFYDVTLHNPSFLATLFHKIKNYNGHTWKDTTHNRYSLSPSTELPQSTLCLDRLVVRDALAGPNLRTIGASQRFVISLDSSHHSGPAISKAEVDSLVRSSAPIMTTVTAVTSTVNPALIVKEKTVKPSLFSVDSSSAGRADPNAGMFSDLTGSDFLVGGIRTIINLESNLQKTYVP